MIQSQIFLLLTGCVWLSKPSSALVTPSHRVLVPRTINGGISSPSAIFSTIEKGFEMANVFYDNADLATGAWEWTANIGAPAALVAGAVLASLSETREDTVPKKDDPLWVRRGKKAMRFLLLSSFALEIVAIFSSTMIGSVLLGRGTGKAVVGYTRPLQLLKHHHEFEYLLTQVSFLQGLLNWLGAVAIEVALPKAADTKSAMKMNKCLSSWLVSLIVWVLAFYNHHLTFFSDYTSMIKRLWFLFCKTYFSGSFRPLSVLYVPLFALSLKLTWEAFTERADDFDESPQTEKDE